MASAQRLALLPSAATSSTHCCLLKFCLARISGPRIGAYDKKKQHQVITTYHNPSLGGSLLLVADDYPLSTADIWKHQKGLLLLRRLLVMLLLVLLANLLVNLLLLLLLFWCGCCQPCCCCW